MSRQSDDATGQMDQQKRLIFADGRAVWLAALCCKDVGNATGRGTLSLGGAVPGEDRVHSAGHQAVLPPAAHGTAQWSDAFVLCDADAFPLGDMDNLFELSDFPFELVAP